MRFVVDCALTRCAVAIIMIAIVGWPALARTYLYCSTTRVVVISAPTEDTSTRN